MSDFRGHQGYSKGIMTDWSRRDFIKQLGVGATMLGGLGGLNALLAACSSTSGSATQGAADISHNLTIGIGSLAPSIDPAIDSTAFTRQALWNIYDRLISPDFKGGLKSGIATSWQWTDPLTLEFTLRTGVKFTNGEPVDASAAKFSVDRIMNPETKSAFLGNFLPYIASTSAPSADKFIIHLKQPYAGLLYALCYICLVPPQYGQQKGPGFGGVAVGSGRLMQVSYQVNDHLTVQPNPAYWGTDKVTNFKTITWRNQVDEAARTAALTSGSVDIVLPISPDTYKSLPGQGFKGHAVELGQSLVLPLPIYKGQPTSDKRVRQAINYAIDKESLLKNIMLNTTSLLDGQMASKEVQGYDPTLHPYPYDPAKAKQLLTDAGYPNGFSTTFQGISGRFPGDSQTGQAISPMLAAVGIKADFQILAATQWINNFHNGTMAPIYMLPYSLEPSMTLDVDYGLLQSNTTQNVMHDPVYDKMFNDMESILDPAKRVAALQEMSRYLHDLCPMVWLWPVPMLYGVSPKVQGFAAEADEEMRFHDMSYAK